MTDEEVQALQAELETTKTELETEQKARVRVEARMGEVSGAIAEKDSHITKLEQTIGERDSEIVTLKQGMVDSGAQSTALSESLSEAISAYKAVVVQANNPAVIAELITGDTIEAIDQSLESAKALLAQMRKSVEAEISSTSVPAGAPARTAPDLESLSSREKIQYAITKGGRT